MSLNSKQRQTTRDELHANLDLSGLSTEQLRDSLDFTDVQLQRALDADPATDPADVWLLRDFVEQVVRDRGLEPRHFTVLTEGSRGAANRWFGLRQAPPTPTDD